VNALHRVADALLEVGRLLEPPIVETVDGNPAGSSAGIDVSIGSRIRNLSSADTPPTGILVAVKEIFS
jgi:hypothetical protein